jgi:hypothetical protein
MKNHEGYPDPTANEAINGVRREEKQRLLEKKVWVQAWTEHRNL